MSKKVKHKGGQYCPRCQTNVMAVNDTSFFGSGWCCPNCGEHTVGPLLRSAIQKKERQTAAAPKYNVTCVYCQTALVAPAGNAVKCPSCGKTLKVTPPQPNSPQPRRQIAPPTPPAGATPVDPVTRLVQLRDLRDSGALSEEEFATLKAQLLSGQ